MKEYSTHADGLAPESVTVSWQTAFWALVPLAMSVLVQLAGKVFGLEPRLSFFLRIGPIICAGDLVAFIIRLGAMVIVEESLGAAMFRALEYRDLIAHPEPERKPQDYTWVRVVWFVFILLQAIKLFGLCGMPWLQTWGYFYFFSSCWYEIIAVISPRVSLRLRNTTATHLVELSKSVLFNVFSGFSRFDLALVNYGVLTLATFSTVPSIIYANFQTEGDGTYWHTGILYFLIIFNLTFGEIFGLDAFFDILVGVPVMLFLLFICSSVIFFVSLRYSLARKLLLLRSDVDLPASQLSLSVVSFTHLPIFFVLSLLWFRFSYDPTETAKPDWINVFG
ncbi:hypothetical protein FB567DRAFT_18594 [Paraphoma chrysanthemicola]|uniref:Uncharacterized protein n=1 Tax=Paraphoma chrysanthemicola TaxID=798071 RepID=A0A8K0RGQ8_9PLEO|nr:hypothetical protein FB567DRAFT_18594 [Paraphoma chrysanthemicola]